MALREQRVEYRDGETLLEGVLCHDEARGGPLPAVLLSCTSPRPGCEHSR